MLIAASTFILRARKYSGTNTHLFYICNVNKIDVLFIKTRENLYLNVCV